MGEYTIQEVYVMNEKKLNVNTPVSPELDLSKVENSAVEANDELHLEPENACCSPEFTEGCIFVK